MAIIFNHDNMAYRVGFAEGFLFRKPRHRTIEREYLRPGGLSLTDPDQPMYQTIDWVYDPDWKQQYALEVNRVNNYRYTVKRKFDAFPEVSLGRWNPTVECLQYTEDTTIWIENRWVEFDAPSEEWEPSIVMGEWQNIPEYQSWSDGSYRFPILSATEDTLITSLHFYRVPDNGTYTLRQLVELGYAQLIHDHSSARIGLSKAIKPA